MGDLVRVAVVDSHPLFREGISCILRTQTRIEVVAEGANCEDAAQIASLNRPEILLLDLEVPGGGITALKQITGQKLPTQVIITSASSREEHVSGALDAGARGYFLKSEGGQSLIQAIACVCKGESYVTPSLAARLFQHLKQRKKATTLSPELASLTRRETEILYCVGLGLSNKEIATKLRISEKTVKHYMTNILHKLQVRNRVQAALIAQKTPADRVSIDAIN